MPSFQSALCWVALLATSQVANALEVKYCSSDNTGTGHALGTYIYQTTGYCYDKCQSDSFSWAILQGSSCWCSNEKPTSGLESVSSCHQPCPGYPTDSCGSEDADLFSYVEVPATSPSGSYSSEASSTGSMTSAPTSMTNSTMPAASTTTGAATPAGNASSSSTPQPYTGAAGSTFGTWNAAVSSGLLMALLTCIVGLAL